MLQLDLQFYCYCCPKVDYACITSDGYLNKKTEVQLPTRYTALKHEELPIPLVYYCHKHQIVQSLTKTQSLDHSVMLPSNSNQQINTTNVTQNPFFVERIIIASWVPPCLYPPKNETQIKKWSINTVHRCSYLEGKSLVLDKASLVLLKRTLVISLLL